MDFARQYGVPVEVCGKLVVATSESELPALSTLAERAEANGVPAKKISPDEAREYEPEVSCVAALRVESTGIIDFPGVCEKLVSLLDEAGMDLRLDSPALGIRAGNDGGVEVATEGGVVRADALVNCAGLHSDRVARLAGLKPSARIVPFRGEYYELKPERRGLVRGLIYPVPDPTLPFLGVHLTRMLDGSVHAGPNAVLALRREGYRWADVSAKDVSVRTATASARVGAAVVLEEALRGQPRPARPGGDRERHRAARLRRPRAGAAPGRLARR